MGRTHIAGRYGTGIGMGRGGYMECGVGRQAGRKSIPGRQAWAGQEGQHKGQCGMVVGKKGRHRRNTQANSSGKESRGG